MTTVSIAGLDKAVVFAALYNGAKAQGLGFLHYSAEPMTVEKARERIEDFDYFDYVDGRVMKVDISGDELYTGLYNRDNGEGAAEAIIKKLREGHSETDEEIERFGLENTRQQAISDRDNLHEEMTMNVEDGVALIKLTLSDVADQLKPKLDNIIGDDTA